MVCFGNTAGVQYIAVQYSLQSTNKRPFSHTIITQRLIDTRRIINIKIPGYVNPDIFIYVIM